MSISPRPATAPSADSRDPDIVQLRRTNFKQWSAPRGELFQTHPTETNVPPAITSDEHRTTASQGTLTEGTQPHEDANRRLENAATSHGPPFTPTDDPWRRKTLLTLGTFASPLPVIDRADCTNRRWWCQRLFISSDSSRTYDSNRGLRANKRTSS